MLCVALRQSRWLIVWLLICTMMCPAEADRECPKYPHCSLPCGHRSASPSPESKRVMALSARLLMRMHCILTQKMLHRPRRNLLLHRKGGHRSLYFSTLFVEHHHSHCIDTFVLPFHIYLINWHSLQHSPASEPC